MQQQNITLQMNLLAALNSKKVTCINSSMCKHHIDPIHQKNPVSFKQFKKELVKLLAPNTTCKKNKAFKTEQSSTKPNNK
jgi:hypothetical protein